MDVSSMACSVTMTLYSEKNLVQSTAACLSSRFMALSLSMIHLLPR